MNHRKLKDVLVSSSTSIKKTMWMIDSSGLRVAYVINRKKQLIGAVSDSEIRKAIIKGMDINQPAEKIINPQPVVLFEAELDDLIYVKQTVKNLLNKMPDSRYILIVDDDNTPIRLANINRLLDRKEKFIFGSNNKKVLVVGGAGYLGSVLTRKLLAKGFRVKVLDLLMYGSHPINELLNNKRFELIEGDMRNISLIIQALVDVDAVINLAAIVGDPACINNPEATIETNFLANKVLAEACKYHQINRFIFASTCSVYGVMTNNNKLDEDSPLNPVSLYARSKIQSEVGIMDLADSNFSPTILRMSTLYGHSPRMRFDLVVNTMTKNALFDKKITVNGGGLQWRPLVHVEDAVEAFIKCLEAPLEKVKAEIFNVGEENQNFQIIDIAKIVHKQIPDSDLVIEKGLIDERNYNVSFSKIKKRLKYRTINTIETAVLKMIHAIQSIENPNANIYYNIKNSEK